MVVGYIRTDVADNLDALMSLARVFPLEPEIVLDLSTPHYLSTIIA
jgi:hypothetical protein